MAEDTLPQAPETPAGGGAEPLDTSQGAPTTSPAKDAPAADDNLPLREDFIQNAVKFLSHPKVQGSPVQYRREFLEKKGLNSAEITEAFRRVPDTATTPSAALPATTTVTTTTTTPVPAPASVQAPQPSAPLRKPWEKSAQPAASYAPANQQPAAAQGQQMQLHAQPRQGMRWTQMVLAIGLLSAAGAGTVVVTKDYLVPRLKTWLRRWLLDISEERNGMRKLTPVEEAAAAASAAADAAVQATEIMKEAREDIKQASTEGDRKLETILAAFQGQTKELTSTLDSLKNALEGMEASRKEAVILGTASRPEAAPPVSLADLRKELLKFTSVMTGFNGNPSSNEAALSQGLSGDELSELKALAQERRASSQLPAVDNDYVESEDGLNWLQANGSTDPQYSAASKGPVSTPVDRRALGTTAANRAQQGLSAQPASANGAVARPQSAGVVKQTAPTQEPPVRSYSTPPQPADQAPHSKSYMDVVKMLQEGKPIPGIRDIDDKPPNPNQAPTDPKMKPLPKPWEKGFQQVSEKPPTPTFNITNSRGATPVQTPPVYSTDGQAPWWRQTQPLSQPSPVVGAKAPDEEFVHPALATDIDGPSPAPPVQSSPPGVSTTEPLESRAGQAQSNSIISGSSSQAFEEQRGATLKETPTVAPKSVWRPPAVPSFAMPSAADAIKGKGKLVPVTPMAPREERPTGNGVNHSEESGSSSGQGANHEGQSYAQVLEDGQGQEAVEAQ